MTGKNLLGLTILLLHSVCSFGIDFPGSLPRQRQFVKWAERGIVDGDDVFALSGTNLTHIKQALHTGRLQCPYLESHIMSVFPTEKGGQWANKHLSRKRLRWHSPEYPSFDEARKEAIEQAQEAGAAEFVLNSMRVSYTSRSVDEYLDWHFFSEHHRVSPWFISQGLNPDRLKELKTLALSESRGVLVAVSVKALSEHEVCRRCDVYPTHLLSNDGLHIRYVVGLEPLGTKEKAFFGSLKEKIQKLPVMCAEAVAPES